MDVEERPGPPDEGSEVAVDGLQVGEILGLVLELLLQGEVVELVEVLEEPEVVVQPLGLLILLHDLADVEELEVDRVHIHVLALVLLRTEVGLLEGRLEDVASIVLHCVSGLDYCVILLFKLISELLRLVVKVLPNHIAGLLLLRWLQALLALDDGDLLPFEGGLFVDEVEHVLGSVLNHEREVIHPVFGDGPLFGVVLDGQHLAHDRLLEHLDGLQTAAYFLEPAPLHLL